jgi:hypothetical protein
MRFDIDATVPGRQTRGSGRIPLLLFEERFGLKLHREEKESLPFGQHQDVTGTPHST